MPLQPSSAQVHVNRPLTNISIAYMQDAVNFVATRVAPTISVAKQSDVFFRYRQEDFFRDEMKLRAPAAESAGGGYNIDRDTYYANVWALHKDIPYQLRNNADQPIDMDRDATIYLTHQALIRKEKLFAAYMTTGIWTAPGSDTSPTTKWDAANSNPIREIRAGISAVHGSTGYRPNTIILGQKVWDLGLADNPDMISRVNQGQTTGPAMTVQATTLSSVLGVDRVLVMGGVEATSQEGAAVQNFDFIGPGDSGVLIAYIAPSPGIMQPSALYTFAWTGHLGANAEGGAISTFPLVRLKADRVEIEMAIDIKQVAPGAGYFIPNVLAV
jgi:hypothetical protein